MKKNFLLAVMAIIAAVVSCGKIESKINDLDEKIDKVKQETITTISEQVAAVNASISDLENTTSLISQKIEELNAKAKELKESQEASEAQIKEIEEQIAALDAAREVLKGRISDLEGYAAELQDKMDKYAQEAAESIAANKLWAESSLATLEQWAETEKALAEVEAIVEGIDQKITDNVTFFETKMQNWINNQLEGFTKIARFDSLETATNNKIAKFKDEIDSLYKDDENFIAQIAELEKLLKSTTDELKASIQKQKEELEGKIQDNADTLESLSEKLESMEAELQKTNEDLEKARTELTEGYKKVIADAIEECHGKVTKEIQDSIAKVDEAIDAKLLEANNKIIAIGDRVTAVEGAIQTLNNVTIPEIDSQIAAILARLEALEGMIQSIVYIPEYSDGKARLVMSSDRTEIETEKLLLKFLVCPAAMADSIVNHKENFDIKARSLSDNGTSGFFNIALARDKYTISLLDKEDGIFGLEILTKDLPAAVGTKDFVLSVVYDDGLNDISSSFVTVAIVNPVWEISCKDDQGKEIKAGDVEEIGVGKSKTYTFSAVPYASYDQFSYYSEYPNIADILNTGNKNTQPQAKITGKDEGETTIHVSLPDLGTSYSANDFIFKVKTVDTRRTMTFDRKEISLDCGKTLDLNTLLTITPALGENDAISFSMQGNRVDGVSLSSDGVITNNYRSNSNATRTFTATVTNSKGRYDQVSANISVTFNKLGDRSLTWTTTSHQYVDYGKSINLRDILKADPAITNSDVITYESYNKASGTGRTTKKTAGVTGWDTGELINNSTVDNNDDVFIVATVAANDSYQSATTGYLQVTFNAKPKRTVKWDGNITIPYGGEINLNDYVTVSPALEPDEKITFERTGGTNFGNGVTFDAQTGKITNKLSSTYSNSVTIRASVAASDSYQAANASVTVTSQPRGKATITFSPTDTTLAFGTSIDLKKDITIMANGTPLPDAELSKVKFKINSGSSYGKLDGSMLSNNNSTTSNQTCKVTITVAESDNYTESTGTFTVTMNAKPKREIITKKTTYQVVNGTPLDLANEIVSINPALKEGEIVTYKITSTSKTGIKLEGSIVSSTNTYNYQREITISVPATDGYSEGSVKITIKTNSQK